MEIAFLPQAAEDLEYWKRKGEVRILKRIRALLADMTSWNTPLQV